MFFFVLGVGLGGMGARAEKFTASKAPRILSITNAGNYVIVSGDNGVQGNSYHVLAASEVDLSVTNWTRVATNLYGDGGTFSFTNTIGGGSARRYYLVESIPFIPSSPCLEELNALGIAWSWGPESPGVETPVTVTLPLGGMPFRYLNGALRQSWFMDCELAVALHRMTQLLAARGVVEVVDIGIYNYRCIGGGTPPDCPQGLSMHAKALAVDIAGLVTSEFGRLSVEDDWMIDADGVTCFPRTRGPEDAFLHAVLCDLYNAGIFTIHLTPNYNAAHRNHWHLDLTPDSGRFIR